MKLPVYRQFKQNDKLETGEGRVDKSEREKLPDILYRCQQTVFNNFLIICICRTRNVRGIKIDILEEKHCPTSLVVERLRKNGAGCDCEVLDNVNEQFEIMKII